MFRQLWKVEMRPQRAFRCIGPYAIKSRFSTKCFIDQRHGLSLGEPLRCVCCSWLSRLPRLLTGGHEPELPACFLQKLPLCFLHGFGASIARIMHSNSMLIK